MSFNPRTPCGVRLSVRLIMPPVELFQSTHSLRSATLRPSGAPPHGKVSIHALLAECDGAWERLLRTRSRFNPRTPCGVRPVWIPANGRSSWFQSTHSLRSATKYRDASPGHRPFQSTHSLRSATAMAYSAQGGTLVSIHALLAECDSKTPKAFTA